MNCLFIVNVHMPKDRITQAHQGYGFIEFMGEDDADYAIKIMNMIKVYGKPIRVNKVIFKCFSTIYWLLIYLVDFATLMKQVSQREVLVHTHTLCLENQGVQ